VSGIEEEAAASSPELTPDLTPDLTSDLTKE
jgi:hypothetical protein